MQILLLYLLLFTSCSQWQDANPQTTCLKAEPSSAEPTAQVVLRSTNAGETWDNISGDLRSDLGIWRAMLTTERIFLLTEKSIYERPLADLGSDAWTESYFPLENLSGLDYDDKGLVVLAYQKGVFRTLPGAETLLPIHDNLPDKHVRGYTVTTSGIFLATDSGLYRSTDKGITWQHVFKGGFANKVHQTPGALFATSDFGIIKSVDDGSTWKTVSAANKPTAPITQMQAQMACIADDRSGDEPRFGAYLYYSSDGGQHWNQLESNLPDKSRIEDVALSEKYLYCSTRTGVYRSEDLGKSWKSIHAPLDQENGYLKILVVGSTVFLLPVVGC